MADQLKRSVCTGWNQIPLQAMGQLETSLRASRKWLREQNDILKQWHPYHNREYRKEGGWPSVAGTHLGRVSRHTPRHTIVFPFRRRGSEPLSWTTVMVLEPMK